MSNKFKIALLTLLLVFAIFVIYSCNSIVNKAIDSSTAEETKNVSDKIKDEANEFYHVLHDETNIAIEVIEIDEDTEIEETDEQIDTIEYIVDILSISDDIAYGDTASLDDYSGKININISKIDKNIIYANNTYVITADRLLSMEMVPTIQALKVKDADENDIITLDNYRKEISNYNECIMKYDNISIEEIVRHANSNYVYWTQEQRAEYINFLNNHKDIGELNVANKVYIYNSDNNIDNNIIIE